MQPVAVRILHPEPAPDVGPLTRSLAEARSTNAERLAALFRGVGADDVLVDRDAGAAGSFGARLRGVVAALRGQGGLVVLGSGAIPLAEPGDIAVLLEAAASGGRRALANSFYSADVVAVGDAAPLASLPDLQSDNGLPRWLAEEAGFEVRDLSRRWRLAIDLDSPLDVFLTLGAPDVETAVVGDRVRRVRAVVSNAAAELVVAGRTSSSTLRWLERSTASRTRALIEERGLRTMQRVRPRGMRQRPPRSVLGMLLDERGAEALGSTLAQLGDAAVIDSRVLLAHRLGPDESRWPRPEDRFASDLLLADRIADPWLRALTASAHEAAIPIVLGGHTLVGPGIRLALGRRR